jgi:hypothetical protein
MQIVLKSLLGVTGVALAMMAALFLLKHYASEEFIAENRSALSNLFSIALAIAVLTPLATAAFWLATFIYRYKKARTKRPSKWAVHNRASLEVFGATPEERSARIDEVFDKRTSGIDFALDEKGVKCDMSRQLSSMPPVPMKRAPLSL